MLFRSASPSFLFIQEAAPEQNKPHGLLTNRELAIRLSYYLWACPPDEELYNANLSNIKVYENQVDRLLADPKSQGFRDGFAAPKARHLCSVPCENGRYRLWSRKFRYHRTMA